MHGGFYVLFDEAFENSERDNVAKGDDDDLMRYYHIRIVKFRVYCLFIINFITLIRRRSVIAGKGAASSKAEWR